MFEFIPENDEDIALLLEKAKIYLECGESKENPEDIKKDMDYRKDWKYIVPSFESDYHIDLSKTDLHFWQFYYLLTGLTDKSMLSRVRDIRNYDLSTVNDEKFKEKNEISKKRSST